MFIFKDVEALWKMRITSVEHPMWTYVDLGEERMGNRDRNSRVITPEEREFLARLRAVGVEVTPSTVPPGQSFPAPLVIPGFSLSEVVLEERGEQP